MTSRPRSPHAVPGHTLLLHAAEAAVGKKASDLVGLDLSDLDGVADYFFICSAASEPQVKAIAEAVEEKLRALGAKPWHVEGREGRRWVLLDYVDLVVHVFLEETRRFYDIERLYSDVPILEWRPAVS